MARLNANRLIVFGMDDLDGDEPLAGIENIIYWFGFETNRQRHLYVWMGASKEIHLLFSADIISCFIFKKRSVLLPLRSEMEKPSPIRLSVRRTSVQKIELSVSHRIPDRIYYLLLFFCILHRYSTMLSGCVWIKFW